MARQQSRVDKKPASKKAAKKTARIRRRDRDKIKRVLEDALRAEFSQDTVDVSDGYQDNIHILVVSRRFDAMDERSKQDMLWSIIDGTPLSDADKHLISLVLPVSPTEIK